MLEIIIGIVGTALAGVGILQSARTKKLSAVNATLVKIKETPRVAAGIATDNRNPNYLEFWVQNCGECLIYDIEFDDDLHQTLFDLPLTDRSDRFDTIGIVKHGISYMVPGERRAVYIGNATRCFEELMTKEILIRILFKDSGGNPYDETFRFRFREFEGLSGEWDKLSPALKEIRRELKTLNTTARNHLKNKKEG